MKWFKHDADAGMDPRLMRLRIRYGMAGYGLYWYCLERIVSEISEHKLTFELEHDAELLAHDTGIHVDDVNQMMSYMVEIGLFENSGGVITCLKLAKRLDQSMTSNNRMRSIIEKIRGGNHDAVMISHDAVMTESCKKRTEEKRTEEKRSTRGDSITLPRVLEIYHEMLPTLPAVQKVTKTREGLIRQRIREDLPTEKQWRNYFLMVSESKFLMGKSEPTNGRPPFRADLEWLCRPSNIAKVAEGKYNGV